MLTAADRLAELDAAFRRDAGLVLAASSQGDVLELERLGVALLENLRASIEVLQHQLRVLSTVLRLDRELTRDNALQALGARVWDELEGRSSRNADDA